MKLFIIMAFFIVVCLCVKLTIIKHTCLITKNAVLKNTVLLKKCKLKNRYSFSNAAIYINNKRVKFFKVAICKLGIKLFKHIDGGMVILTVRQGHMLIKFNNLNCASICFYSGQNFNCLIKNKVCGYKILKRNYHYNLKHAILFKTGVMQNAKSGFIVRFFNYAPNVMHSNNKCKKTTRILNQKVIKIINNNAVLIKNYNQPIKNVFNVKINSVINRGSKTIINKTYVIEPYGEHLKISLLNNVFIADFSLISSFS